MKFNLKNRPKITGLCDDPHCFSTEVYFWFEGFENELKEKLKLPLSHPERSCIEAILGEP